MEHRREIIKSFVVVIVFGSSADEQIESDDGCIGKFNILVVGWIAPH